MATETITIAGKDYKPAINSTMENDVFNQAMIARAGLDRLKLEAGETPEKFALRVYQNLAADIDVFMLLGGMIIPADKEPWEWSEEMAANTAMALRKCTDPADKKVIQTQISAAIVGFLRAELISIAFTQRFSAPKRREQLVSLDSEGDDPSENGPKSSVM